ncbi:LPS-assembly protein LptD [Sphingomonas sp. DBB INV C78]|uniref:LPS-assembly protein LptD n=1 Tax=Sphingomonas sp. DBB INV C78 TaxID=3349434 RepID=UPI0036D3DF1C
MIQFKPICLTALPLALALAQPAWAQNLLDRPQGPPPVGGTPAPANDEEVVFSSETLAYDNDGDIVTAMGDVRMVRAGNRLRADKVIWNRKTGEVTAEGSVAVVNPGGDTAYGDNVRLTDTLKDGVIENLLLVLEDGGRLAADRATRVNGVSTLDQAAYTPCNVTDENGCPQNPSWMITAVRVVHDPVRHRISYDNARLTLFGVPLLWLPGLSHPDSSEGGGSGLLMPQVRISKTNGFELATPYYVQLAPNRDLTLTPHVFTEVLPAIEAQYRELNSLGAFSVGGYLTYGKRQPATVIPDDDAPTSKDIRGYFEANGRFQLTPEWSLSASARATTDKTFLRRYDISRDDRLRSTFNFERIDATSYLSVAGWAVQGLRTEDRAGRQPIALPAIDYRLRLDDPLLDGRIELQANSLALLRTEGQDTQRAFAGARWDLRRLTNFGQEVTFTAYARGDVYHTDEALRTLIPQYQGTEGWSGRGIVALAADMRWPFVGEFFSGSQRITPRVQVVATPKTENLDIPNEDARSVDLEDSNLFALNRFPGYDRWEDGSRVTYGLEWAVDLPRFSLRSVIGQSYRLNSRPSILPEGTGLSGRHSDVVGRTSLKYGQFVELTHRYRLDKDNLAIRRNEMDVTIGSSSTYVTASYLRLNRDIDATLEDLRDREELRAGARIQIARYWSVFGSTVINLTGSQEDPLSIADGYEPVRHRLGFLYDDECIELGLTWRRDYDETGDARRGNTFLFRVALKNLGR